MTSCCPLWPFEAACHLRNFYPGDLCSVNRFVQLRSESNFVTCSLVGTATNINAFFLVCCVEVSYVFVYRVNLCAEHLTLPNR